MSDYNIEDEECPKCQHPCVHTTDCTALDCEDGYYHDCMEDCCCCADPVPNRRCDECGGHGYHKWCPNCGWDLLLKMFINGVDERERKKAEKQ